MLTNSQTVAVQNYVARLVNLRKDLDACKESRKETVQELKESGLPAAELIRLRTQDPEKMEEAAQRLILAGQVLGREVYAEKVESSKPDGNVNVPEAERLLDAIAELDQQIKDVKTDIKAVKKEAKGAGFVPDILERVAEFRINPEKAADYRENNVLIKGYLKAVEGPTEED